VGFKKWVSFHGVSVNVNNDLTPFSRIRPCGEGNIEVTSVKEILGEEIETNVVKEKIAEKFEENMITHYGYS